MRIMVKQLSLESLETAYEFYLIAPKSQFERIFPQFSLFSVILKINFLMFKNEPT